MLCSWAPSLGKQCRPNILHAGFNSPGVHQNIDREKIFWYIVSVRSAFSKHVQILKPRAIGAFGYPNKSLGILGLPLISKVFCLEALPDFKLIQLFGISSSSERSSMIARFALPATGISCTQTSTSVWEIFLSILFLDFG